MIVVTAHQLAMHAQHDIVLAYVSTCMSITLWYCIVSKQMHVSINSFHHLVAIWF